MVGAGEFVSVSQLAGLDTKASPWPQEWLKLQTFNQITLTCAKALARRGHSGVLQWSLLSQLQAGPYVQQLLQSAGATF